MWLLAISLWIRNLKCWSSGDIDFAEEFANDSNFFEMTTQTNLNLPPYHKKM